MEVLGRPRSKKAGVYVLGGLLISDPIQPVDRRSLIRRNTVRQPHHSTCIAWAPSLIHIYHSPTMHLPLRHLLTTLLLLTLAPPTLSARSTATSFCKCICFNNSTIIALNPPSPSHSTSPRSHNPLPRSPASPPPSKPHPVTRDSPNHLSCSNCNRAFCLEQNLRICKEAKEEDVFATCFQRDSVKDETVVIVFLIATIGLLGWAAVKPWVERVREGRYLPLSSTGVGGPASQDGGGIRSLNNRGGQQSALGRDESSSGG